MNPENPSSERLSSVAIPAGGTRAAFSPEPFGKYYLVDKIAVGGMAEIFKAMLFGHAGFEKVLVIKRILSHLSENDEFVDMFVDEAKVSVALQHANIVQTYDFGRIGENYYIAMECVEGKDVKALLRKLSKRRKLLPIEFAVYIAHEVCKGLDYAHRRIGIRGDDLGIVHRDMSPSNVLLSYEGEVKLADFGIAKAANNTYNTKDGVLKGKFEYMSPEQASGQDLDRRSDIFSSVIILYEFLTGRMLFKTSSEIKTLETIKACQVDPPSILNPTIPARLDEIVLRALARDPADRYQDACEFQHDLLEFLYPATPDLTRQSFAHFMRELFVEELQEERYRLGLGARIAAELNAQVPEMELEPAWEESGPHSGTLHTQPSRGPAILGAIMVLLVLGIGGMLLLRLSSTPPPVVVTTADLNIRTMMPAKVFLDDELVGEGSVHELTGLEAGQHVLRVLADGYEEYEEIISLQAGEKKALPVMLEEIPTQPEPPAESANTHHPSSSRPSNHAASQPEVAASEPPTLRFESRPSGAQVLLDGGFVGKTPMSWTKGEPGAAVRVEYRMDGYEPLVFQVHVPAEGASDGVSRSMQQVANEPGKVSVSVSGVPWAYVLIDGGAAGTTPLYNHELKPGAHVIQVKNEQAGLDLQRSVQVGAGEQVRVTDVLRKVFASSTMWMIALGSMMIGFVRRSVVDAWWPMYFKDVHGISSGTSWERQITAWGIALAGIAGGFAFGMSSDRIYGGRRAPVIVFGFSGMALTLAAFYLGDSAALGPWFAVLCLVSLSFFVNGAHGMIGGAASMDFGGRKAAATAAGLFDGMQYVAGAFVGVAVGQITEMHNGWQYWKLWPIPFAVFGALVMARLWNAMPKGRSAGH